MTTMLEELDELIEYEGPELIIGKDTRIRVDGRNQERWSTKASPFRFVCHLEIDGKYAASGTLIGPQTVLTAGHCLHYPDGKSIPDNRIRVIPGRRGDDKPFPTSMSKKLVSIDGYAPVTRTDVGIITLADRIGETIGWWTEKHSKLPGDKFGTSILRGPLPIAVGSDEVNLSGYPGDKPPNCAAGTCGKVQYLAYDYTKRKADGLLYYLNDIYYGHSGGPVWIRRHPSNGGRVMVAVHVGAAIGENFGVFIDSAVRKFITDHTVK